MLKKLAVTVAATTCLFFGFAGLGCAAEMGPEEIVLETTNSTAKKPKPSVFPHKAHQELLKCGDCHHGMADGKQVPYVDGQEIGKCESCHNSEVLPGVVKGKLKLDTFKGAGHANCLACHKEVAAKDEAKKALKKCSTCHPKKK